MKGEAKTWQAARMDVVRAALEAFANAAADGRGSRQMLLAAFREALATERGGTGRERNG